ncbi:MAG: hypothetical protein ACWGQW_09950 [bacterium]
MKKKIVRFKGKRHNLYFNDEGPQHLIPLDKDGKEVPNVKIEEFEESDIEELKMFDEEYVGQLRDENKKTREALESLQKQFEGLDPEQLQEMAKKLKDAEDAKEKERQEALKKEGKWQELMDQQKADFEKQLDAEKTRADTAVRDLESYRVSTVLETMYLWWRTSFPVLSLRSLTFSSVSSSSRKRVRSRFWTTT